MGGWSETIQVEDGDLLTNSPGMTASSENMILSELWMMNLPAILGRELLTFSPETTSQIFRKLVGGRSKGSRESEEQGGQGRSRGLGRRHIRWRGWVPVAGPGRVPGARPPSSLIAGRGRGPRGWDRGFPEGWAASEFDSGSRSWGAGPGKGLRGWVAMNFDGGDGSQWLGQGGS